MLCSHLDHDLGRAYRLCRGTLHGGWGRRGGSFICVHIHAWYVELQGQIQELKGGGAKVKYVHTRKFHPWPCPLWCKGYAKLGGGKLGEDHGCTQGVWGKDVFPPRRARKKNSVNYTNCIRYS